MKDCLNMSSFFFDTNFFLDILDKSRDRHSQANKALSLLIEKDEDLFTSSDIISTISYFLQKRLGIKETVLNIDYIVENVNILSSTKEDFLELNRIILKNSNNLKIDYEDCMQLYLANRYKVEAILTSDKTFCGGLHQLFSVEILYLDEYLKRYQNW